MSECKRNVILIFGHLLIFFFISCSKSNVQHFSQSINYCNQATQIQNTGGPYEFIHPDDMEKIVDFKKKALEEARLVDIKALNRHYPDFGNHYRDEFIKGLELFIEGHEQNDNTKILAGQMLDEVWGAWYDENVEEIKRR